MSEIDLRHSVLLLFILITSLSFVLQRLRKKERWSDKEDLSQFEKDENGLYPWEVDTDNSPERIDKSAKRYVNQHQPRRGRWN